MALGGQFEGQNGVQVALGGQLGGPSGVQMEPKLRKREPKLQKDFLDPRPPVGLDCTREVLIYISIYIYIYIYIILYIEYLIYTCMIY